MSKRSFFISRDAHSGECRIVSLEGAKVFIAMHENADRLYPCCYGHLECSTYRGGPCFDETLGNFPELNDW